MPQTYISSSEFRDGLNNWYATNNLSNIDPIAKSRGMIPDRFRNYTRRLYLAVSVSDEFIDRAASGRATFNSYSFWTKDEMYARSLLKDSKNTKDKYNILITKNIEKRHQILDVDEFASFMGVPQLEMLDFNADMLTKAKAKRLVIIAKELTISRTDYTIVSQQGQK